MYCVDFREPKQTVCKLDSLASAGTKEQRGLYLRHFRVELFPLSETKLCYVLFSKPQLKIRVLLEPLVFCPVLTGPYIFIF